MSIRAADTQRAFMALEWLPLGSIGSGSVRYSRPEVILGLWLLNRHYYTADLSIVSRPFPAADCREAYRLAGYDRLWHQGDI